MVTRQRRQLRDDLEHILYDVKDNSDDHIWAYRRLEQGTPGMYVNDASTPEIRDFTDQAHQNAGAHAYLVGQQTQGGPAKDVDLTYQLTSMPSLLKAEAAQRIAFQAPFGFDEEGNRSVLRLGGYDVKEPRSNQRPTRLALNMSLPQYFPEQTHIGAGTSFQQQSMISTQDKVQHGVRLVGGVYLGENTEIGERTSIGPGTILANNTRVGSRTSIQATILPEDHAVPERSTITDGDIRHNRKQYTVRRCQPQKTYVAGEQLDIQPRG